MLEAAARDGSGEHEVRGGGGEDLKIVELIARSFGKGVEEGSLPLPFSLFLAF